MPLQIYLTESGLTLEQLGENVLRQLETDGRCIVVVSEGFDVGDLGTIRDNFGHVQFSSSQKTVAQTVVNYLNTLKFPVPGKARGQVPGTDQRNAIAYASVVDLDEAYGVGCHAVEIARKDGNGWMATILRDRGRSGYSTSTTTRCRWRRSPTPSGSSPSMDRSSRIDVTDEFLDYAQPLIGEDWVSVPMVEGLPGSRGSAASSRRESFLSTSLRPTARNDMPPRPAGSWTDLQDGSASVIARGSRPRCQSMNIDASKIHVQNGSTII